MSNNVNVNDSNHRTNMNNNTLAAKSRRATKDWQWVLRAPLHIGALVFLRSVSMALKLGFRSKTPFPLCHCLVGRCLPSEEACA